MQLGRIIKSPLRDTWETEWAHFTPWLADHLVHVSEALGLDLELEGVETAAGDFSADIVARDVGTDRRVIIENQYGATDHRHLGQILTYSSVLDAGVVVWIAERVRPEHKLAVDFLNKSLKDSLQVFALEAHVIRIDDSNPAFMLEVVCMPTESARLATAASPDFTQTQERYRQYFQPLLDELREVHRFTNARIARPRHWCAFASARSTFYRYSTGFAQRRRARVEVFIDCGDEARNKAIFDALLASRPDVEARFGDTLSWERLDTRRSCRIALYREGDITADAGTLADIRSWAIANLLRMRDVLPPFLDRAIVATQPDLPAATCRRSTDPRVDHRPRWCSGTSSRLASSDRVSVMTR